MHGDSKYEFWAPNLMFKTLMKPMAWSLGLRLNFGLIFCLVIGMELIFNMFFYI